MALKFGVRILGSYIGVILGIMEIKWTLLLYYIALKFGVTLCHFCVRSSKYQLFVR